MASKAAGYCAAVSERDLAGVPGFDADPLIESPRGAELVRGLRDLGVTARGNQDERALIVYPSKSGRQQD